MTLQQWMKDGKWRQEDVALMLRVSQPTVSRILAGRVTEEHRDAIRDMTDGAVVIVLDEQAA